MADSPQGRRPLALRAVGTPAAAGAAAPSTRELLEQLAAACGDVTIRFSAPAEREPWSATTIVDHNYLEGRGANVRLALYRLRERVGGIVGARKGG